jgi:hypothetical protein
MESPYMTGLKHEGVHFHLKGGEEGHSSKGEAKLIEAQNRMKVKAYS